MGSGFKDFSPGAILTAADVDGYLMRQGVMTFATSAARDAALSGVLDEGMVCYLEDAPNRFTFYDGSAWQTMQSDWTTWTPTYTNLTVGNGTVSALYAYVGPHTVTMKYRLIFGSTTTMGTGPSLTLPVLPVNPYEPQSAPVVYKDFTGGTNWGALQYVSGSTCNLIVWDAASSYVQAATPTATVPFTWATSDFFSTSFTYQV